MPWAPKTPCSHPGCGELIERGARACETHERERRREVDHRRGSAAARGYGGKWRAARLAFLKRHPLCEDCLKDGTVTAATEVDHVIPHKGDQKLFWKRSNWRALCKPCHSKKTATEDGGFGNRSDRGGGSKP
jgi:5-methylcytosine-specific restriction protein A